MKIGTLVHRLFVGCREENGVTTITVIALISLIISMMTASILVVQSDRVGIVHRISRDKAIAVAEGGLNDYLWRLNKDHEYYLNYTHPAQGVNGSGQPNYVTSGSGEYHLDVTPPSDEVPMVTVKSIGRVKDGAGAYVQRSITAQVRMKRFTDYVFMTDFEVVESSGNELWWKTGDVVDGPLHTNDDLHTDGTPLFKSKVTMAGVLDRRNGTPTFEQGYEENSPELALPPTNLKIKDFAVQGGYYYYGQTTILMNGSSLIIVNNDTSGKTTGPKGSVSFPPNGVLYVDGLASAKYTAGNGDVYLRGSYSGKLTIGAANIIYATGDIKYIDEASDMLGLVSQNYVYVNHYSQGAGDVTLKGTLSAPANSRIKTGSILKAGTTCTNVNDKTALGGTWTGAGPYTLSTDRTTSSDRILAGSLNVTAGTRLRTNSILKTDAICANIDDVDTIGGNWSGVGPYVLTGEKTLNGDVAPQNIEIDAAIAAVNHSFGFERYEEGDPKGTLTVRGSMTQKYRGPVAMFSGSINIHGYNKDYIFDPRMEYLTPPHFIEPANAGYEIVTWNEGV